MSTIVVACAFVDDGHPLEIEEPRLSTTYTESGLPLRAGLELWPVEQEPEEQTPADAAGDDSVDDDNPGHSDESDRPAKYYPRRVAGESARDASLLALPTVGGTRRAVPLAARGAARAPAYTCSMPAP